jgi:hypothetical protein
MRNKFSLLFLGLLLAILCLGAGRAGARQEDDTFSDWTHGQLVMKIKQLEKEVAMLRSRPLVYQASAPATVGAAGAAAGTAAAKDMVLDDFEGDKAKNGEIWATASDAANLGTTLFPSPFKTESGGSPLSPGHSARIHGHLGSGRAPWPWALLALNLPDNDLRAYSGISFYLKGRGTRVRVQLLKGSVKDFAHFSDEVDASSSWRKVTMPFADFKQPAWAAQVPAVFDDVEKIAFQPASMDADYDFQIDDLTLVH